MIALLSDLNRYCCYNDIKKNDIQIDALLIKLM